MIKITPDLEDLRTIPKIGAWAMIRTEIPAAVPVDFLDIHYVYNETLGMSQQRLSDLRKQYKSPKLHTPEYGLKYAPGVNNFADFLREYDYNFRGDLTKTYYEISCDSNDLCRVHAEEVSIQTEERIEMYLNEGVITICDFGDAILSPLYEETTKELLGALQLDGLSEYEAWKHLTENNVVSKSEHQVPRFYYRMADEYKEYFS